ncbi:unnamed protein product [Closterium sp. Yama58-4]|nr:unnamed protein product [Closterium sp. Yama58-4]
MAFVSRFPLLDNASAHALSLPTSSLSAPSLPLLPIPPFRPSPRAQVFHTWLRPGLQLSAVSRRAFAPLHAFFVNPPVVVGPAHFPRRVAVHGGGGDALRPAGGDGARRANHVRHGLVNPSIPVAIALSPFFPSPSLSPLYSRHPRSLPSLPVALALSLPFPSPSLSPLHSRRHRSLPSLPVALALSPPLPSSPSLSALHSVALALSLPVPSPSLSPLPSRRPRSLPSIPVAIALSPPFPSPSLSPLHFRRPRSLRSLPVAIALSPPFPSPSMQSSCSSRPSSLPSHHPTSFRDFSFTYISPHALVSVAYSRSSLVT